jgi:hypothetical protein
MLATASSSAQTPKLDPDNPLNPFYTQMLRSENEASMNAALESGDIATLQSKVSELTAIPGGPDFLLSWFIGRFNAGGSFWINTQLSKLAWNIGVEAQSLNQQGAALFKTRAVVAGINALAQIRMEGTRCEDPTAWQAHWDALLSARPLWEFATTLPVTGRQSIVSGAMATQEKIAPLRRNDAPLCTGGLDSIGKALENPNIVERMGAAPGLPGRTVVLSVDPKEQPNFVPEQVWRQRQQEVRKTLPALLASVLQIPVP